MRIPPELERSAVERLKAFRAKRSAAAVQAGLRQLKEGAQGDANLQGLILNAVKSGATLGEVADELRGVFGLFQDQTNF